MGVLVEMKRRGGTDCPRGESQRVSLRLIGIGGRSGSQDRINSPTLLALKYYLGNLKCLDFTKFNQDLLHVKGTQPAE